MKQTDTKIDNQGEMLIAKKFLRNFIDKLEDLIKLLPVEKEANDDTSFPPSTCVCIMTRVTRYELRKCNKTETRYKDRY